MTTFTWIAYNVYTEQVNFNTLSSKFENGVPQRRAKRAYPERVFVLQFEAADWATEAQEILDFFLARLGGYEAFYWVNPNDDVTYQVTFAEDMLNLSRVAYQIFDLKQIRLIENKV